MEIIFGITAIVLYYLINEGAIQKLGTEIFEKENFYLSFIMSIISLPFILIAIPFLILSLVFSIIIYLIVQKV